MDNGVVKHPKTPDVAGGDRSPGRPLRRIPADHGARGR